MKIIQAITPEMQLKVNIWFQKCQEMITKYNQEHYPNIEVPHLIMDLTGRKYIKIIIESSNSRSAWAFINVNGDILKPSTWSRPALHARGNISDADGGMKHVGPYGPAYLK